MKSLENLLLAARNRVAYIRTLRALRDMSGAVARDFGIDRNDPRGLARRAVYGA